MAGIEAIGLGNVSLTSMAASQGTASVSAEGTKQFEQFLKKGDSAKESNKSLEPVKESQDTAYAVNCDYTKREELSTGQAEEAVKELTNSEAEAMETLQEGIRNVVKENLGIDDETLDAVLQSMGIVVTDLLNPAVLQQFVLLASGGQESTDFLMNEEMLQSFTNVMQAMEDFKTENQTLLISMMEKLENPITLEEFLQQEGIDLTAENSTMTGEQSATLGTVDAEVQNVSAQAGTAEQMQDAADGSAESDNDVQIEDLKVKTAQSEDSVESEAAVKVTDNTGSAEEDAQDSMQDGQMSQNANDVLFAQREAVAGEDTITTPLFADKLNSFLQDGVRFLRADVGATQKMQQMIDIVNQVSERIRSTVNADTSSVEMQLNPESLGKVYISVVSKNGVMTATFNVQSEEAKNALESQILTLRENLEAKNLKVESVEVQVSDFSFTQSNQAEEQNPNDYEKQNNKKFRYDFEEESETVDEVNADAVRRQVMRDSGGSIDFTA